MSKIQFQWIIAIVMLTTMIIVLDYFVEKYHADITLHLKAKVNPSK